MKKEIMLLTISANRPIRTRQRSIKGVVWPTSHVEIVEIKVRLESVEHGPSVAEVSDVLPMSWCRREVPVGQDEVGAQGRGRRGDALIP